MIQRSVINLYFNRKYQAIKIINPHSVFIFYMLLRPIIYTFSGCLEQFQIT